MSKVIEKRFYEWEFEEEEQWLNEMVSEGWVLQKVGYSLLKLKTVYTFEKCEPEEYNIRIDFIHTNKMSNRTKEFVNFVSEMGVEKIETDSNFLYFKKKKSLGDFELYSDDKVSLVRMKVMKYSYMFSLVFTMYFFYDEVLGVVLSGKEIEHWGLVLLIIILFIQEIRGLIKIQLTINNLKKRNVFDDSENFLLEKGNLGLSKNDKIYMGIFIFLGLMPYLIIASTYTVNGEVGLLELLSRTWLSSIVACAGVIATISKDQTKSIVDIQFAQPVIICTLAVIDFYVIASILGLGATILF